MIGVTGANGQLGRLVLKQLAKLTSGPIRALVRSPEKAGDLASSQVSVVKADYNAPDTLSAALEGVERLVLISGSEVGQRVPQHSAVIEAAQAAGVKFIVYTSILNVETSTLMLAREHLETEKLLKESGVSHAALRNSWYLENYFGTVATALQHGAVFGASGDGVIAAAAREDYAEAAASVITGADLTTRTYELAGKPGFTLADLAAEISSQTGRDIPFNNLPEAGYAEMLVSAAGLPEMFARVVADADRGAAAGELDNASTDLETLLGHPSKPLSTYVSETLAALKAAAA